MDGSKFPEISQCINKEIAVKNILDTLPQIVFSCINEYFLCIERLCIFYLHCNLSKITTFDLMKISFNVQFLNIEHDFYFLLFFFRMTLALKSLFKLDIV